MLTLKPKQKLALDAINDPAVDTLILFGTVGTGKTDIAAHIVISICQQFPKSYWPVFRQNLTTAKKSVIPSYELMLDRMNLVENQDYTVNRSESFIRFENGSVIPFVEADVTKDRGAKKIKGVNATGNHIDEADELDETMFITAVSRKGRRNENGQPSVSIITFNPTDGQMKALYYDRWRNGTLPPNIRCIEFGLEDSWQSKQDIEALKTNPRWWTERYLYNNWEYADESTSLFKSRAWAASIVNELDGKADRAAGYDVARSGTDRSVRALGYGLTIADIKIFKDKEQQIDTAVQGDMLIADAVENSYGLERTAVDAVGLGVGTIDAIKKEGYDVQEYMSGAKPDPTIKLTDEEELPVYFDSLRSQMIYLYARGVETGVIKHFSGCPYLKELQSEAMLHNYDITDKVLKVESKDRIKKRLGASPDILDAVIMMLYVALRRPYVIEWMTADMM